MNDQAGFTPDGDSNSVPYIVNELATPLKSEGLDSWDKLLFGALAGFGIMMLAIFVALVWPDEAPPPPQPPVLVGDSGSQTITPTENLVDAAAAIEQAHEGIGNIIHHDDGNWDNDGCGVNCERALSDAVSKRTRACFEIGPDITSLQTWDHNQTVGHACDAAGYWLGQTLPVDDATHHAEYQLGILRDALNAVVKQRSSP
ncbi:hypothetical protein [Candidatus Poriferisocius sp.]|uniref:hypothetical protein n=1 Tax=Candidatus Poriferisocius sp. TaxID=3101276 RepID=UPI003B51684D